MSETLDRVTQRVAEVLFYAVIDAFDLHDRVHWQALGPSEKRPFLDAAQQALLRFRPETPDTFGGAAHEAHRTEKDQ